MISVQPLLLAAVVEKLGRRRISEVSKRLHPLASELCAPLVQQARTSAT